MEIEELRQLERTASREVSCDHRGEVIDQCDECLPVNDAKVELMWAAPKALPVLFAMVDALTQIERELPLAHFAGYVERVRSIARTALSRLEERSPL